jgi:hypothetical protein
MADPLWPAGQWQDHDYRDHHTTLFHQLSTANVDESKLVESMLQLPPQWREQGSFELGGTSASTGPIICPNSSQGEIKSHDSPGLFQLFNPAFGTNDEVFRPQPELAVPGSSQLLQPFESFPASQATQDHILSLASDLGQATPSGSGVQAQPVYPPAFSLIGYMQSLQYQASAGGNHSNAVTSPEPQPSQGNHSILHAQSQRQFSLGSFGSTFPSPVDNGMEILQRQAGSDGLPMHGGPSRGKSSNFSCFRRFTFAIY